MLGLRGPDEYEIAVCGYTSDLEGKNLQSEWYAIKVPYRYVGMGERKIDLSSSAKEKEKVKINRPRAKANVKGTIKTEPLHPFSVARMMHQSTQHAFLDIDRCVLDQHMDSGLSCLYSLGSDGDGDGAHPFESKGYGEVWSLNVNKPDAGWEAVPLTTMTFPNRYNPQLVALRHKLYVLGGFSRSQFSAEAAAKRDGWMESYHPLSGWKPLPNPPSAISFYDDPLIFTAFDDEEKILVAQYNHDDMNCDSATFYVYDVKELRWTILDPPVRKLLARYPDRTGRRSVAVGNTLYWSSFEDEEINVQAYDLYKDIWFHGSFNIPHVNDDPLIFTAFDDEEKILVAQYNHDDMNCDSATFYVYDVKELRWTILDPPVRKLLARYPDRTGRRSVAVGNTLYWSSFEDEEINVQAYDLYKDIWFHGSFNIPHVLGKDEFLADNVFPASPPLLHLANQKFCLFLLTSIYDEKNCEVSNLYLNCLILNVSPINARNNHQHDYYDHVCYKVRRDVNVDDKEYKANYHVHPHNHFWRLRISFASIQKYPLVNPIQLGDAVLLILARLASSFKHELVCCDSTIGKTTILWTKAKALVAQKLSLFKVYLFNIA
nr:hypothetical protein CFP56_60811 [Quercus suber]